MGVYGARGLELHLMLKTGQRIIVLDMQATDDRLLNSQCFAERKQTWFENLYAAGSESCTPIDDFDVITLTDSEKQALQAEVRQYEVWLLRRHNTQLKANR